MSFNKTKYDAYDLSVNRSIGPGDYRLFSSYAENENQCFSSFGPVGSKSDVSLVKNMYDLTYGDMANVESNLSWRHSKLSKENKPNILDNVYVYHKNDCNKNLTSSDTRFTHPLDNYRSMSLTDYHYQPFLFVNPQCYIQDINDKMGLNSRLYSKDMYIMNEPTPLEPNNILPKPKDESLKLCNAKYIC
jgi:hypothetical protein